MSQFTTSWFYDLQARRRASVAGVPAPLTDSPESELHGKILDECRRRGWLAFHGRMARKTHRTRGEPDFILLADGGRTLLVECKRANGKTTPAQNVVIAQAERLGHTIHVVRSFEQFLQLCPT